MKKIDYNNLICKYKLMVVIYTTVYFLNSRGVFMFFQKRNFFLFVLLIIVMLGIVGCYSSTVPITKNIINEVGEYNTTEFQYYVSKTITLKLIAEEKTTTIADGQLIRKSLAAREQIIIPGNLPGLVRNHGIRTNGDGYYLEVAFEKYDGNPIITFGQYFSGNDEKYYILYNDDYTPVIKYGNYMYTVNFDGDDAPYLFIQIKELQKETSKERKASGLKLGQ